ncbi:hypothetical protein NE237_028658 [Protea cynaroides]|uniref:Dof zinc finger protein n=1 Tax=Protea cynaroides TaxID=273540 RepID=A0A9Q0JU19_9MAGN|nr:hypothetical protein NE237_028658 [Protea cynaroides]
MDTAQWPQVKPMEEMVSNTCSRPMSERRVRPQKEQALNCPRCNSTNTKFCYYNNYSLTQPRYFCKTCRRYWTEGGSLRNVPVGGGSRKNKRSSNSSSSSSSSKKMPDLNPSTSSSQNPKIHEGGGYGSHLHGVHQESSGRHLFPFEDLRQVSSNTEFEQNRGQGDSTGYWSGMLGGGSWLASKGCHGQECQVLSAALSKILPAMKQIARSGRRTGTLTSNKGIWNSDTIHVKFTSTMLDGFCFPFSTLKPCLMVDASLYILHNQDESCSPEFGYCLFTRECRISDGVQC